MTRGAEVDGCGPSSYYKGGYAAMGAALEASGRDIVYSCSWPAYINSGNETLQPFGEFINDGCNLWRNWHDIQCTWRSLASIIDQYTAGTSNPSAPSVQSLAPLREASCCLALTRRAASRAASRS